MTTKTPRQLLSETLQKNAREVAVWPEWMRSALSTATVFYVPTPVDVQPMPNTETKQNSVLATSQE